MVGCRSPGYQRQSLDSMPMMGGLMSAGGNCSAGQDPKTYKAVDVSSLPIGARRLVGDANIEMF